MANEPISTDLAAFHRAFNERTQGCWESYSSHRAQVTGRLLRRASRESRLLILGAGNCNDLDLPALAAAYHEVVLVDLDEAALAQAQRAQFPNQPSPCVCVCAEITGFLPQLLKSGRQEREASIKQVLGAPLPPAELDVGRFDVVASTCVLSQLINAAISAFPEQSQVQAQLAAAIRRQHLQLMLFHLKTGGRAVLFSDFVSSDTAPELLSERAAKANQADLQALAAQLLQKGNFFFGLHPGHLMQELAGLGGTNLEMSPPWLWQMGSRRFLVLAAEFSHPSPSQAR